MSADLAFSSARDLAELVRNKSVSSVELTRLYIERIERLDGEVNAVVVRKFERALETAKVADDDLSKGRVRGPLHGLPMTIKESYVMADTVATWGIEAQRNNYSAGSGLTVHRFQAAGAHFLGKTNVPVELADIQSFNPIYGTTRNPWDLTRTPGGSSGGSAAAMAAGFSALEAGSDIGGSIRTPAAFCGVYGHKPTWGVVPQSGHELIEGVPEPDVSVCGPLARDAVDLAFALDVMAGPVEREAAAWRLELPNAEFASLGELRVALWPDDPLAPVATEIADQVSRVGDVLAKLGATVSDTARPEMDVRKSEATYRSLATATMASGQPASHVAQMQKVVDGLDPADDSLAAVNARASVMSHRQWIRHNFRRERLRRAWDAFFEDWDIVVCPQAAVVAFPHDQRPYGERSLRVNGEERPYFEHIFWAGIGNVACLPCTAFPVGRTQDGLPIGLQAMSASYRDHRTIEFARLLAREIGGFERPPGF